MNLEYWVMNLFYNIYSWNSPVRNSTSYSIKIKIILSSISYKLMIINIDYIWFFFQTHLTKTYHHSTSNTKKIIPRKQTPPNLTLIDSTRSTSTIQNTYPDLPDSAEQVHSSVGADGDASVRQNRRSPSAKHFGCC